jgi:hypothetical protein
MRNFPRGGNYDGMDILNAIRQEIAPLASKMTVLEEKINDLNRDRVTRSDLEKLTLAFVPRDAYEARHAQLVDRDKELEADIRDIRKELEDSQQKIHDRLESGKQQLEDRMKQIQEVRLTEQDRWWLRISQLLGGLGFFAAVIDFLLQHIHFQ